VKFFIQQLPVVDGSAKILQIILCGFESEIWKGMDKEAMFFFYTIFMNFM